MNYKGTIFPNTLNYLCIDINSNDRDDEHLTHDDKSSDDTSNDKSSDEYLTHDKSSDDTSNDKSSDEYLTRDDKSSDDTSNDKSSDEYLTHDDTSNDKSSDEYLTHDDTSNDKSSDDYTNDEYVEDYKVNDDYLTHDKVSDDYTNDEYVDDYKVNDDYLTHDKVSDDYINDECLTHDNKCAMYSFCNDSCHIKSYIHGLPEFPNTKYIFLFHPWVKPLLSNIDKSFLLYIDAKEHIEGDELKRMINKLKDHYNLRKCDINEHSLKSKNRTKYAMDDEYSLKSKYIMDDEYSLKSKYIMDEHSLKSKIDTKYAMDDEYLLKSKNRTKYIMDDEYSLKSKYIMDEHSLKSKIDTKYAMDDEYLLKSKCIIDDEHSLKSKNRTKYVMDERLSKPNANVFLPEIRAARNKISVSKYIARSKFQIDTSHTVDKLVSHDNALEYIHKLHRVNAALNGLCLEYIFYNSINKDLISIELMIEYFKKHKSKFRHKKSSYTQIINRYTNILNTGKSLACIISYMHAIHNKLKINKSNIITNSKTKTQIGKLTVYGATDFIQNNSILYELKTTTSNQYAQWKRQLYLYSLSLPQIKEIRVINLYLNEIIFFKIK